jgi:MFS transporter, putative metabolite transport protein
LFPILLDVIGTRVLLYGLIATSILGAVVTWLYQIETTGVNLDEIGRDSNDNAQSGPAEKVAA